jgi:hypothetical protein
LHNIHTLSFTLPLLPSIDSHPFEFRPTPIEIESSPPVRFDEQQQDEVPQPMMSCNNNAQLVTIKSGPSTKFVLKQRHKHIHHKPSEQRWSRNKKGLPVSLQVPHFPPDLSPDLTETEGINMRNMFSSGTDEIWVL